MKEFDIGYLAAMIDRHGYIGISITRHPISEVITKMRPEISIRVRGEKAAAHIQHALTKEEIAFRTRETFGHKERVSYPVYSIVVSNLDAVQKLVHLIESRLIEKERIATLSHYMHAHFNAKPKLKWAEKEKYALELFALNRPKKRLGG